MLERVSHDPYRAAKHTPAPQIVADTAPLTERPLRVLAWPDRYVNGLIAGGETALHGMLAHLAAKGHEVDVATAAAPGRPDGAPVVIDGVYVWPETEAPRLLDHADVLIGHLLWTKRVVQASARGQVPLVYLFHNTMTVEAWGLRGTDVTGCVYNAEWVRQHTLSRHRGWGDVPSTIVRPPVRAARFELPDDVVARRAADGCVTLVNPNPDKGAHVFYGLAEDRPRDRFLAVAGGYGQQVHPRQPQHRNVAWQHQTSDMAGDVYARTRVLLMPSRYESWGMVAVEAFCSGIPVVAHPTPGLTEALGDAAVWANRDKPKEWLRALGMLEDPDCYAEWSARARARAVELDAQADRDLAGFEWLIMTAAAAERVPSAAMVAHDPYRAQTETRPHTVERVARRPGTNTHHDELAQIRERSGKPKPPPPAPGSTTEGPPPAAAQPPAQATDTTAERAAMASAAAETAAAATVAAHDADVADAATAAEAKTYTDEGAEGDVPKLAADVPERAADVIAWIADDDIDDAERYDRAEAAEYVEKQRPESERRTTVIRAYDPVLYD